MYRLPIVLWAVAFRFARSADWGPSVTAEAGGLRLPEKRQTVPAGRAVGVDCIVASSYHITGVEAPARDTALGPPSARRSLCRRGDARRAARGRAGHAPAVARRAREQLRRGRLSRVTLPDGARLPALHGDRGLAGSPASARPAPVLPGVRPDGRRRAGSLGRVLSGGAGGGVVDRPPVGRPLGRAGGHAPRRAQPDLPAIFAPSARGSPCAGSGHPGHRGRPAAPAGRTAPVGCAQRRAPGPRPAHEAVGGWRRFDGGAAHLATRPCRLARPAAARGDSRADAISRAPRPRAVAGS